ncbi:restriction endonuclease [Methylomonas sp. ZR1]|uniref:restriction endonuclease n=1 Tax=Methylomonas sp. ZR1 TaxID=1797072 RepID=UPI0014930F2F|nr:restriction endonuclease [Methylomonas sp. ZR1]NOV29438.1 hypothetical protein [Methylomonas sp. ZR1]
MTRISTEYEVLVRDLHAALVRNDQFDNVNVLHNVKINGRSGATYQIDVYWEFKVAGVTYKTCIECKHYNSRVKKSDVASFVGTIQDIGNVTGVFATTVGYQQGAVLIAKANGVRLVTVNHLLKSVSITSNFTAPNTDILQIKYDEEQAKELLKERGLTSFSMASQWNRNTVLFDANGEEKIGLVQFVNETMTEEGIGTVEPVDIYDKTELGLLRIAEVQYRLTMHRFQTTDEVVLNDTARAIMEDVLANQACYLNDDGSVSKIET